MFDVCLAIIRDPRGHVLLGEKQRGIGTGNVVGVGGKLEPGETPVEALVREVREESGLVLAPGELHPAAVIEYTFPSRPAWSQRSHVFTAQVGVEATPISSDELTVSWFSEPPYARMWADAREWLPQVLAGSRIVAEFTFAADCQTVEARRINVVDAIG